MNFRTLKRLMKKNDQIIISCNYYAIWCTNGKFCFEEQVAVDETFFGELTVKEVKANLKHKRKKNWPKYLAKPSRMHVRLR